MKEELNINLKDARRIFDLLENMNEFFHQEMNYNDSKKTMDFADKNYQEIRELYYRVIWHWLPPEVQKEIENR